MRNDFMAQNNKKKTFTITPSWKQFFWGYVLSVCAIPLAGLGLITLYFVRKKHSETAYKITDDHITKRDSRYEHNVDLVDIENVDLRRSWLQQKLDIGDLILHTSASQMELAGLEEPQNIKDILESAIKSEQKRQKEKEKTKARETPYQPGSMEKVDYLTGLWQQGLISDEDYKKERKHFE